MVGLAIAAAGAAVGLAAAGAAAGVAEAAAQAAGLTLTMGTGGGATEASQALAFTRVRVPGHLAADGDNIPLHSTCFRFRRDGRLRRACIAFAHHSDNFVVLLVVANAVALALHDPLAPADSRRNSALRAAEVAFNSAFTVECMVKMVALGVYRHRNSYLRSNWNQLDFFIVVLSWLPLIGSIVTAGSSVELNFGVIRSVRVLKLLRGINHNKSLQQTVETLLKAINGLLYLGILFIFFFFAFGVLGVQAFRGALRQRCEPSGPPGPLPSLAASPPAPWAEERSPLCGMPGSWGEQCPNGTVCSMHDAGGELHANPNSGFSSFDNIGTAWIVVFQCLSQEGWSDAMYEMMDVKGPGVAVFFVVTVLLTSFFAANLALGVIYEAYRAEERAHFRADRRNMLLPKILAFWDRPVDDKVRLRGVFRQWLYNAGIMESLAEYRARRQREERQKRKSSVAGRQSIRIGRKSVGSLERPSAGSVAEESNQWLPTAAAGSKRGSTADAAGDDVGEDRGDSAGASEEIEERYSAQLLGNGDAAWYSATRVRQVIESNSFINAIVCIIALNTIVLAVEYDGMSEQFSCALEVANAFFAACFGLEMLLKLYAYGARGYFRDGMNVFDAVIVVATFAELGLAVAAGRGVMCVSYSTKSEVASGGLSALRLLRLTRIFRSIKIVRHWPTLSRLAQTITQSSMGMISCIAILMLFAIIFALFGMEIYGGKMAPAVASAELIPSKIPLALILPHRPTFDSFGDALLTVFQLTTGEGLNLIMFSLMEGQSTSGAVFAAVFVSLVWIVCKFVALNIFLAILVHNYSVIVSEAGKRKRRMRAITAAEFDAEVMRSSHNVLLWCPKPKNRRWKTPEADEMSGLGLTENKAGMVFYLDVARALATRITLNKSDMQLSGIDADVRDKLDANLARAADSTFQV
eukprot:g1384.t1